MAQMIFDRAETEEALRYWIEKQYGQTAASASAFSLEHMSNKQVTMTPNGHRAEDQTVDAEPEETSTES